MKKIPTFLILIFLMIPFFPLSVSSSDLAGSDLGLGKNVSQEADVPDYRWLASNINRTALEQYIGYFSGLGSRMIGYPGYYDAQKYIYDKFNESLADVTYHEYPITVPVDYGARLTVLNKLGMNMTLYPFWPNVVALVTTPPEGISGPLIYVHRGELKDFSNKTVEGSIVLMDFNSEMNWINAVDLGAKAVIFIGTDDTTTYEANMKHFSRAPLSFPRYYISNEDVYSLLNLLSLGEVVTTNIKSQMRWETINGRNIIGFLPGTDEELRDQYILITAHYDSFSFIPSLSPGAEATCGISSLLDLLSFYSGHPAKYTLVFVAFSGTPLGLVGSRWFMNDYVIEQWDAFGSKTRLAINLDMTTRSTIMFPHVTGKFYALWEGVAGWVGPVADWVFGRAGDFREELEKQLEEEYTVITEGLGSYLQWPNKRWEHNLGGIFNFLASDAEVWTNIDGPGFTFATSGAQRYYGTPLDTPDKMSMGNLEKQLRFIWATIYTLVNTNLDEEFGLGEWTPKYAGNYGARWANLRGKVAFYDYEKAFYEPLSDVYFLIRPYASWAMSSSLSYLGVWLVVPSDSEGNFFIPGLATSQRLVSWEYTAYGIDPDTGSVNYAPDRGRYSTLPSELFFSIMKKEDDMGVISLFKCGSVVFVNLNDPSFMNEPLDASLSLVVYDHNLQSVPIFYGFRRGTIVEDLVSSQAGGTSITMVYAEEGSHIDLMVKASYASRYPLAVLVNATDSDPLGTGYGPVRTGKQIVVTRASYSAAKDFYQINDYRLSIGGLIGLSAGEHTRIFQLLNMSDQEWENKHYDRSFAKAGEAWFSSMNNYRIVRSSIEDSINNVPFFALLIVPFALLAELFFFSAKGVRRIFTLVVCYLVPIILLYMFHPGFVLASDASSILLSSVSIIFAVPILWVLKDIITDAMRSVYLRTVGISFERTGLTKFAFESISVGIQHMKKRGLRTTLSVVTLILITWAMVSFSSMSAITTVAPQKLAWSTNRDGILVHHRDYAHNIISLSTVMVQDIEFRYSGVATIAPRAWSYAMPDPTWNSFRLTSESLEKAENFYPIFGLLGATPQEVEVTRADIFLVEGRWFVPQDKWAAIISKNTADSISVTVGDIVKLAGIEFTVIGIVGDEAFFSQAGFDLDAEQITPLDFKLPAWNVHLPPDQAMIIPYKTCIELGGAVHQVAMSFQDESLIMETGYDMFARYLSDIIIFIGLDGEGFAFTGTVFLTLFGWQFQIVPLIICGLVLLTTSLGNVTERGKEISILSSLGLAPSHILFMFTSESLVYGVVGGVVGYLSAMMTSVIQYEYLGLSLNYSSTTATTTLAFTIVISLGSVLYPALKASRTVTPSMERRWRLPNPRETEWNIPLPFTVEVGEVDATINYLIRFIEAHRSGESPDFMLQDWQFEESKGPEGAEVKSLRFTVGVTPLDLGVSQENRLNAIYDPVTKRFFFTLVINLKSGLRSDWMTVNKNFTDIIRKQLLQWRALKPEEREPYYKGWNI